ncbi:ABC transporter substrate binding protein [Massilia sp. DJPM01]|uniref:ABC transporter substrate-binding protein n=1 Tax=Massilia sp. DJPM01 TaxID=3024404 RepID=UPI00259DED79|nr:ABC transporter substrate binding protein [Massilia sp. DJPM01]MDM5177834.1 ABC transporter substrate binding protein [Massilia sp. DJPM01]
MTTLFFNARPRAPRGASALLSLLLLAGPAPHAMADDLAPATAESAGLLERYDSGGQYGLQPLTVSQLEDQLRRPELQAAVGQGGIAVLYPNVSEPFRSAFIGMIQGIEERTRLRVRSYAVDTRFDAADLNAQLRRTGTKVVIALGRQGLNVAAALDRDIEVLVGGALLLSDAEIVNLNGISLTPDPALLFARLRTLLPDTRRVIVVYDPRKTEWLLRLAREAAREQGLELASYEARDLSQAAQLYATLFAGADSRRDAVWLPHDTTTVEEGTLLPLILKQAWNSGVPIFSSNVLHVKKGALFAMSPNNVELGRSLASSAEGAIAGERRKGVQPLRELHAAINLRTASHMGLNIGYQQQRTFDLIYPEP